MRKLSLKKILFYFIQIVLIPAIAFAAGKATVSTSNMNAQPIAGINSAGEMTIIKTDNDGVVQFNCIP